MTHTTYTYLVHNGKVVLAEGMFVVALNIQAAMATKETLHITHVRSTWDGDTLVSETHTPCGYVDEEGRIHTLR